MTGDPKFLQILDDIISARVHSVAIFVTWTGTGWGQHQSEFFRFRSMIHIDISPKVNEQFEGEQSFKIMVNNSSWLY